MRYILTVANLLLMLTFSVGVVGAASDLRGILDLGTEQSTLNLAPDQQQDAENLYEILLRSRQFTPQVGIEPELIHPQADATSNETERIHVLLQLYDVPSAEQLSALQSAGIELLNYIPRNAWFASISVGSLTNALMASDLKNIVRWAGAIRPEDKMPFDIWSGQIGNWAISEDGRVRLAVSFFDDIALDSARQIVSQHGADIEGEVAISNKLLVVLQPTTMTALVLEDGVRWIDQIPPPPAIHNDGSRVAVNANQVQAAPYNLFGQGVIVGIWDSGAVDWNHGDFKHSSGTSRVISRTNTITDHATHVAGTMGGNGARSQVAGGTDCQWRGIAPNVSIVSYDFNIPINDYNEAINTYGIVLSQNSWGWNFGIAPCSYYGDYRSARDFDLVVTGQAGKRLPIVFSAGNERGYAHCSAFKPYGNITPPGGTAKNTITVGAINSNDNTMTWFSSWGPVDDGRLKPEVAAPGCQSDGDGGINSTIPDLFIDIEPPGNPDDIDDYNYPYDTMCGTSMAAPVVSGISALLIEQYRKTHDSADPWPATIKALLVQSARDLDDVTSWHNPGPDYASGYGLVDTKGAVDLVRAKALRQDTITHGETDSFDIWVPPGAPQLKVTLAWDDPAGTENAALALVNDLDIILVGPQATYYPWVLDPANPAFDASRGRDAINNLEQVIVVRPVSGKWTVRINGFTVPQGPQRYSVVSEAFFDILEPSRGRQVYAGPASNPQKVVIQTTKPQDRLTPGQFRVTVDGRAANILTLYEGNDRYVLEIMPAPLPANGSYDLSVLVPTASVWNVKEDAILFANTANVDVALVIDRSGSMGTDKMNAAKDAAKQFVDLMQYDDMIGVVSFDDRIETNYPLTAITRPAAVTPLFSDDMESGTGKWQADAPWGLTTASYRSPSHAWTDSPSGDYGNNVNVALRTAAPIPISNAIATPVLTFWQRYDLESGYDKGYVEISTNGGTSWTQLGSYVTGTNLSWHIVERDLTPYKGQNVLIRFRLQTDSSVTRDGWYVDDVIIGQSTIDVKTQAKSAIDSLTSRGTTSIGGGLQRGQEQLSTRGQANHPWAIVLLSDGLENTAPYVRDVLPAIRASKTTVHTVGLGSDADEALMLDIAAQTGGTYNFAPTPQELAGIYNTIAGAVANRQTLLTATGVAQQGMIDQKDVVIDSTVSGATFSLSWTNSSSTIDLVLRKPNGQIIDPTVAASDPNVEYVAGSTYKYYRVIRPTLVTGVWQIRITGGSVTAAGEKGVIASPAGESYTVRVTAQAVLTARFYLDRNSYLTTEPIKFVVTLSDQQPIRNATVQVSVQAPSQAAAAIRSSEWINVNDDTVPDLAKVAEFNAWYAQPVTTITLYDDGLHGDGPANDGVYANTFSGTNRPGTWVFSMSAGGWSNLGETFARFAEISTFIAPNPNPRIRQLYLPLIIRGQPGATWHASGLTNRTVLDLSSTPTACNTLLAATDAGVYRSLDGGRNWAWAFAPAAATGQVSGAVPAYEGLAAPAAGMATAVAVCPANANVVYAGGWGSGVYRSADGGSSWQQRTAGLSDPWIYDLAVAPNNCEVVYAATSGAGVFKTSNGGGVWQAANTGLGNALARSLVIAPNNPGRLYLGTSAGVYRSDNSGAAWAAAGSLPGVTAWGLAVAPANADQVYAGLDGYGVYRSANGGSTWQQVVTGLGNVKARALLVDPLAAATLYVGRDDGGGVYRSLDSGGSWAAFNAGLGSGNVKALWLDGGSCRRLLAGTTNGAWYFGP